MSTQTLFFWYVCTFHVKLLHMVLFSHISFHIFTHMCTYVHIQYTIEYWHVVVVWNKCPALLQVFRMKIFCVMKFYVFNGFFTIFKFIKNVSFKFSMKSKFCSRVHVTYFIALIISMKKGTWSTFWQRFWIIISILISSTLFAHFKLWHFYVLKCLKNIKESKNAN